MRHHVLLVSLVVVASTTAWPARAEDPEKTEAKAELDGFKNDLDGIEKDVGTLVAKDTKGGNIDK